MNNVQLSFLYVAKLLVVVCCALRYKSSTFYYTVKQL